MCRNLAIGCAGITGIFLLVVFGLGAYGYTYVQRQAPDGSTDPVSVSGRCPVGEVEEYAAGEAGRLTYLSRIGELNDPDAIGQVPLGELRADLAAIEKADVPECVEDIKESELAVGRAIVDALERMQSDGGTSLGFHRMLDALVIASVTREHMPRIREAYEMLDARLDIDVDAIRSGGYPGDAGRTAPPDAPPNP